MSARDFYHKNVIKALQKDGWIITHDPYRIKLSKGRNLFVDLGAERLIAAQKDLQKIAVEIKSFRSPSDMKDLEDALGQFILYDRLLARYDPDRTLYLAIPDTVRQSVFEEEAGMVLLEDNLIRLFSFNPSEEKIIQWIP
jgi:hypothetical protein